MSQKFNVRFVEFCFLLVQFESNITDPLQYWIEMYFMFLNIFTVNQNVIEETHYIRPP